MIGDLNAKHMLWGSPVNDFRGKTIAKFIDEQNMVCLNKGEGTRLNYNGTISHLDLAICSGKLGYQMECDVINDSWGSDHYPLMITYETNIGTKIINTNKYNYNNADWNLFYNALLNDLSLTSPIANVEIAYNNLVTSLKNARDISVPTRRIGFKHKYSPFWTPQCSEAKLIKKTSRKIPAKK